MPKYKVLKPIGFLGERFEAGSELDMSAEEATNIGSEYLEEVGGELSPADPTEGQSPEDEQSPEGYPEKDTGTEESLPDATNDSPESNGNGDEEEEVPEGHVKHVVTEDDLAENPDLVEQGVNVGDEIFIPEEPTTDAPGEGEAQS